VLAAVLAAAVAGVSVAGYVAPLPLVTRAATGAGAAAVAMLAAVLARGAFGRRVWCRTLCPAGALLSLASLLRLTGR
jgi:polyferredoxin